MEVTKLNESYTVIDSDIQTIKSMFEFLKVEIPGGMFDPLIKSGFKSPYEYFGSIQHEKLLIMNGHVELLESFGVKPFEKVSEFSEEEIDLFLEDIVPELPFPPYDFQITAFKESVLNGKQINRMCTGSGKSLTIALLAEFLRRKNKKGILLVPNINLLTQFKSDIKDYELMDLYNDLHVIGGGSTDRHFNNALTISTWQSMLDRSKIDLNELDYVITDESHRFASEETSSIVKETINCKYKWGFTGTVPESPVQKMQLFGLFGLPKTYVTSRQLIDRKLATPIHINSIFLDYSPMDKKLFKESGDHQKKLKFIKEHEKRNEFIVKLSTKLEGNSLVLAQHIEHLKTLYLDTMAKLYPEVTDITNAQITGKKSFEFQKQYGVYYIAGSDDNKTRELTRKILEVQTYKISLEDGSTLTLDENQKIKLMDGSTKLAKDLSEDDDIDEVLEL